jgi:hypothetical protein
MKDGIVQCSICRGLGSIRYKIWHTRAILEKILELRNNGSRESEEEFPIKIDIMKIECPLCENDGLFDWVRKITRGDIKKNWKPLVGNMDIFYSKLINQTWPLNYPKPDLWHNEVCINMSA